MMAAYIIFVVALVLGLGIALFFSLYKPYMKTPFTKLMPKLAERAAFLYATRDMEQADIYTRRGEVRHRVSKKVDSLAEEFKRFCDGKENEFFTKVKATELLDEKDRLREKDFPKVLEMYLDFAFDNKRQFLEQQNADLVNKGLTAEKFFELRDLQMKNGNCDSVGVYIIFNETQKKYYVGQAKRLFFRVNQHLTGHGGNGDVYADFKNGDRFFVQLIPINSSGYSDIDALERDMIAKYRACSDGYNKTKGNR